MEERAEDRPDRRAEDAEAATQPDRPDYDAEVVEEWREPVEEEALLGHENLAKGDRRGEDDRRDAHDSEERDVQLALSGVEARRDEPRRLRRDHEQHRGHGPHDEDRTGQDGPTEVLGGRQILASEGREDRDERGRESARDDHVEGELGHTNAALYASSSLPAPNVRANIRSRMRPMA